MSNPTSRQINGDELTTIRTKASKLVRGDTVFMHAGADRIVRRATTNRHGTWIMWDDGERDSFPPDYIVYRVEVAW